MKLHLSYKAADKIIEKMIKLKQQNCLDDSFQIVSCIEETIIRPFIEMCDNLDDYDSKIEIGEVYVRHITHIMVI